MGQPFCVGWRRTFLPADSARLKSSDSLRSRERALFAPHKAALSRPRAAKRIQDKFMCVTAEPLCKIRTCRQGKGVQR